jgi:hypothetical protein
MDKEEYVRTPHGYMKSSANEMDPRMKYNNIEEEEQNFLAKGPVRNIYNGFDINKSEDRKKQKVKVENKIYPHNILFEENVVIHDKSGFIEQFLKPEIFKRVLSYPDFQQHFINNISKETNVLKRSVDNGIRSLSRTVSERLQSSKIEITEKEKNLYNKMNEIREQIDKLSESFKVCMDGINDRLKKMDDLISTNKKNTLYLKEELEKVISKQMNDQV